MSNITKIQWCDSTVNPVMGCYGCELYPKPKDILNAVDSAIKDKDENWPDKGAEEQYKELINKAHDALKPASEHHSNELTTTNIYHLREQFVKAVAKSHGKDAAEAARKSIAQKVTCYAAKLHLNKGYSILNPDRKPNKGYAPTFEKLKKYSNRMKEAAELPDLLGQSHTKEPWKERLPRMIFVSDMGDAFSDKNDFNFLREEVMPHITSDKGKKHLWLWLTKRPHIMQEFSDEINGFPDNLCAMTTMTSGDAANQKRLRDLKKVNAKTKGLSIEPLWKEIKDENIDLQGIDWVIVGGESGSGNDTHGFHLEWAESLRKICDKQGVAFFLKQLGERPLHNGKAIKLKDKHGGDWDEWPHGFKHREFPKAFHEYRKGDMVNHTIHRPSTFDHKKLSKELSDDEKTELNQLETTIKDGMTTFMAVGQALYDIREKKLYRQNYESFKEYCEAELGMSRQHAYRQIKAARVKILVDPYLKKSGLPLATTERQLREFGRLDQNVIGEVIDVATEVDDTDATKKDISFEKLKKEVDRISKQGKAPTDTPAPKPNTQSVSTQDSLAIDQTTTESPPHQDGSKFKDLLLEALKLTSEGKESDAETLIRGYFNSKESASAA